MPELLCTRINSTAASFYFPTVLHTYKATRPGDERTTLEEMPIAQDTTAMNSAGSRPDAAASMAAFRKVSVDDLPTITIHRSVLHE